MEVQKSHGIRVNAVSERDLREGMSAHLRAVCHPQKRVVGKQNHQRSVFVGHRLQEIVEEESDGVASDDEG